MEAEAIDMKAKAIGAEAVDKIAASTSLVLSTMSLIQSERIINRISTVSML